MIWRQWECFLEVGRCLSYSRASENLFLNQSVVSYHIQNLENSMGIKLFERSPHSVEFTPTGKALFEKVAPIFDQLDAVINAFNKNAQNYTLWISSTYMINYKIFTPIFEEFEKLHPNVQIIPKQLERNMALSELESGKIGACFAFAEEVKKFSMLSFFPLFSIRTNGFLVPASDKLAEKNEITYRDLKGKTIILPDQIETMPRLEAFYHYVLKRPQEFKIITAPDMLSAYSMVSEGKGICAATDFMPSAADNVVLLYNKEDKVSTTGICIHEESPYIYPREFAQLFTSKYPIKN